MLLHAQTQFPPLASFSAIASWQAIFEATPACMIVLAARGDWLDVNPAGLKLLDADSHAQLQGQRIYSLIVESYQSDFQDLVERVFRGETGQLEFEMISLNGTRRFVEIQASPLCDEQQTTTELLGLMRDITAQKQTEAELRAVQTYHQEIFAQNKFPMWFYDSETLAFLEVNQAALNAYGFRREEFLTMTLHDIRPPEDLPQLFASLPLDATARLSPRQFRHRKKDGTIIHVDIHSHDLTYAGRPARLVAARDITAQTRAAQLLRESEERLQSMLMAMDNIVWSMSGDTRQVLYLNPATARIYGRPVTDFYDNPDLWLEAVYPPDQALVAATFATLFEVGFSDVEYRIMRPDGEVRWLHTRSRLIRNDDGELIRIDGLGTDVTERKQSEARLLEQAMLLNQVQESIILLDLQARVLFWNPGAEQLYGWRAAEVMGETLEGKIYHPDSVSKQAIAELFQGGSWKGELRQFTKDGTEIIVQGYWTVVLDDAGKPKSILGVNHDITEKKTLEAQFLRTQRLESIGTLASGIAHDLNNVLSPMAISVYLLRMQGQTQAGQDILNTMDDLIERGASMIQQVLSFVRGSSGEQVVLSPKHVLREIVGILKEALPKSITLKYSAAAQLSSIFGDPTQLHQAVMNLCVNARDAMPEGGTLTISAENCVVDELHAGMTPEVGPGRYVLITVADTGEGIAPEIRAKIFSPFFTTKDAGKGTGLGLSTALNIVQKKGGFITVYSEVGHGTQFKVYLPIVTSESLSEEAPEPTPLPRGQGELVLVIDDEAALCDLAQKTLKAFGYQVLTATSGKEAIALSANHKPQVIIIDMMMPGMDGPSTMRALQSRQPSLAFIASSALAINAKLDEAKQLGARQVLLKPYTAEMLLRTVADAIQHG
jgi:PAS domain S-box-containing protein